MATESFSSSVYEKHCHLQQNLDQLFPGCQIRLLPHQGACSTTFDLQYVKNSSVCHKIVQFREPSFELDTNLVAEAKLAYGAYVPATKRLDVSHFSSHNSRLCYEMEVITGVPLHTVAPIGPSISQLELTRHENLVRDFADFVSRGWPSTGAGQLVCNGKVGSRTSQKLQMLAEHLPYRRQRAVAQKTLENLRFMARLPIVINHGDTIPSNIMCDPETGHLTGIIDWAEGEYLPFGTCLYGLEHLLGRLALSTRRDSVVGGRPFIYYDCASDLRCLFWQTLMSRVPALRKDDGLVKLVVMAKTIGILLWYGFAWDGGAINRVVNTERDVEELVYLDTFLFDTRDFESIATVIGLGREEPTEPGLAQGGTLVGDRCVRG